MKILIIDVGGIHVSLANKMGLEGHTVWYYVPWQNSSLKFEFFAPGSGVPTITKVLDWGPYVEKADLIVFPDSGFGGTCDYLRNKGYNVYGAGLAEKTEFDRMEFVRVQDELGMKHPPTWEVHGFDECLTKLQELLGQHETNQLATGKYFVKFNIWRGTLESFPVESLEQTKFLLDSVKASVGVAANRLPMVIQEKVEGVEVGWDGFFTNGQWVKPLQVGFENGENYISRCVDSLGFMQPDADKFAKYMTKVNYRGALSMEMIYDGTDTYCFDCTPRCFDDKTEVLTKRGWLLWKDVTITDEICCLNPENNQVFYEPPKNLISYHRFGDMIEIRSNTTNRALSVCVTPNHQMYIKRQSYSEYEFIDADKLPSNSKIPRTGKWEGVEEEFYIIDGYDVEWKSGRNHSLVRNHIYPELKFKTEDWFVFLGLFLSDGNVNLNETNSYVTISQTKYVDEVIASIEALEVKYGHYGPKFQIHLPQMAQELSIFGKKPDRFIPEYVKQSSPRLINIFLDAYCLGDGSREGNGARVICTPSKRIADDLQELFLKAGSLAAISFKEKSGTIAKFGDKEYERKCDMYYISEKLYKKEYIIEKGNIHRIPYNGMVYCAEVSSHVMFVRREGEPYWCGNCGMPCGLIWDNYIPDIGQFYYEIAKGTAQNTRMDLNKYYACSVITSDEGLTKFLKLSGGDNVQWYRYMMGDNGDVYSIPGCATLGVICGRGDSLSAVQQDLDKNSENVSAFFGTFDTEFINPTIDKYLDPLYKLSNNIGFEFDRTPIEDSMKIECKTKLTRAGRLLREWRVKQ